MPDPLPEVIEDIRAGRMVIVVDDEHRENEGDLICAAEHVTPEMLNFMVARGRGLVCVPMAGSELSRLGLTRMMPLQEEGDKYKTAFMDSVDVKEGTTTGISAAERALTARALADPEAAADDFLKPGHMFPLKSANGGVLERAGHTEATVDLARLAGCRPVGVCCEILNDDGTMARRDDLVTFAREHGLKLTTLAEIARHRFIHEDLVELEREVRMPTDYGDFRMRMYVSEVDPLPHLALIRGEPTEERPHPMVRVHSECLTGDVFGSQRCDCGPQLRTAMRRVSEYGYGAIVYMRQEGRGIGLSKKIHAYELQEKGMDTVEANEHLGFQPDLRDYGIGAQILRHLGMRRIRLLTNNPAKIEGLDKYGIRVEERVPLILPCSEYNARYLKTKREKLRHML
ncbi:3,4-dihydroxy-2-butanone-4-phosphate synthase [Kiritimatiella glycovorans]|uniref:3,4-dihydroxy-2-butanone-4-phosphate synthase n=1 Tax=Kiritimatiella glycovorans TaxID=1307763 RepID=UPI0011873FCF